MKNLLEQVESNLKSAEAKEAKFTASLDAFIDGIEDFAKQAEYTPEQNVTLWTALLGGPGMAKTAEEGMLDKILRYGKDPTTYMQGAAPAALAGLASLPMTALFGKKDEDG